MVWEGYRSRLCKCIDFNCYGLFGRDNASHSNLPPPQQRSEACTSDRMGLLRRLRAKRLMASGTMWMMLLPTNIESL
jgi:hypothetical protein